MAGPVWLIVASACGSETPVADPRAVVSDSAGVPVVVNPMAAEAPAVWAISESPTLAIGEVEGSLPAMLAEVRGATRLTSGVIVVADGASNELRAFSPSGDHLWTAGGKGGGPGEFMAIQLAGRLPGDSLVATDGWLARVGVFDSAGKLARLYDIPDEVRALPAGVLDDGSVVFTPLGLEGEDALVTGMYRGRQVVPVLDGVGDGVWTLGPFPGREFYRDLQAGAWMEAVLGRRLHASAAGDVVAVANDDAYRIRVYDGTGGLVRGFTLEVGLRAPDQGDFDEALEAELATLPGDLQRAFLPYFEQMSIPPTAPTFSRLVVAQDGHIWVNDYSHGPSRSEIWRVFDREGFLVAESTIPPELRLLEIGSDHVVALAADELGVERVVVHALER